MNSYIFRVFGTILGVPISAYLIIQAFNWFQNMTFTAELPPLSTQQIQFPLHHKWAEAAINRYEALDQSEQTAVLTLLEAAIEPLQPWLHKTAERKLSLICLGENHEGHLRHLIAELILPILHTDVLMVEGTRRDAARFGRLSFHRDYIDLLGADISAIVRTARAANPDLKIRGIEETVKQFKSRKAGEGISREQAIRKNFRDAFLPGRQHLILYGAFHCSHNSKWLYRQIVDTPPPGTEGSMLNIRVAREHQEATMEVFTYFLDYLNFPAGDYVITNTADLTKRFREWFPFFTTNELDHYGAMIILRPIINTASPSGKSPP